MSKVLERLRAQQQEKQSDDVSNVIADQYIADIKKKAYEEAQLNINNNLIKAATEAELEGYERKIEALVTEHETTKAMLAKSEAEVSRLMNAINSLNNEAKEYETTIENLKNEQLSLIQEKNKMELDHKNTIALMETKASNIPAPAPVIQQAPFQLPEIEFIPIRGEDGRTASVIARAKDS